ncbi:hypothetical protein BDN72DRAFT_850189 [Pluteus cervinus]|uniref:Uncharacterized protein n=1 Tax=Pluteus cervinus TaxID=181527 RepID=A0ACD3A5T6_9AGAR|nr:hypothetical protein BDN72DRAFT_850189 [Pluteus cervinus]
MVPSHPILRQHFDTSDIAFAKIDHEVATLQESIRVLYAFRNTFTPVYRLPPEILARVFSFVQALPERAKHEIGYYRGIFVRWLNVTRVSHHWRNIAIGSPVSGHIFQARIQSTSFGSGYSAQRLPLFSSS